MCLTIPLLIDYAQFRVVMHNKVNQSRWCFIKQNTTQDQVSPWMGDNG